MSSTLTGSGVPDTSNVIEVSGTGAAPPDEEAEKDWSFNGKMVDLTYSDCPLGGDCIVDYLKEYFPIVKYAWGDEEESSCHSHVLLCFGKKVKSKDVRMFDVAEYHPHIMMPDKKWKVWWDSRVDYLMKDGHFHMNWVDRPFGRHNFIRKRADLEAWQWYCGQRGRRSAWPFTLPNGEIALRPGRYDKRCNYLIVGAANWRKSEWMNLQFENKEVYVAPKKNPWDNWAGEDMVIWDDSYPERDELHTFLEYRTMPVQLDARYSNRTLLPHTRRAAIVLCNESKMPPWSYDEGFHERFHVIRLATLVSIESALRAGFAC